MTNKPTSPRGAGKSGPDASAQTEADLDAMLAAAKPGSPMVRQPTDKAVDAATAPVAAAAAA